MKRQLNYELLQFHIREASEGLDDLLRRIEFSMKLPPGVSEGRMNRRKGRKLEEGGLKVSLEHAYHHLNFAWNTRTMEPEQADAQLCGTKNSRGRLLGFGEETIGNVAGLPDVRKVPWTKWKRYNCRICLIRLS